MTGRAPVGGPADPLQPPTRRDPRHQVGSQPPGGPLSPSGPEERLDSGTGTTACGPGADSLSHRPQNGAQGLWSGPSLSRQQVPARREGRGTRRTVVVDMRAPQPHQEPRSPAHRPAPPRSHAWWVPEQPTQAVGLNLRQQQVDALKQPTALPRPHAPQRQKRNHPPPQTHLGSQVRKGACSDEMHSLRSQRPRKENFGAKRMAELVAAPTHFPNPEV